MTALASAKRKIDRMHDGSKDELTPEELAAYREWMLREDFTCDKCQDRTHCCYVYDAYNRGKSGDCLASK